MIIKCYIVKVEQKENEKGNKFNVYKTVDSNGKWLDVRFTQASGFKTDKRGTVIGDGNVDKTRRFPCIWYKSVTSFTPFDEEDDGEVHDLADIF